VKPSIVVSLSSVLFKSYLRAGRTGNVDMWAQPTIILYADLLALAAPIFLLQSIPDAFTYILAPMVQQVFVGLPILLTSAVILAGIMFELGQSAGLSSSEAVNWLPISPREYVMASAASICTAYSPLLAVSVGVTLPLALKFDLIYAWPLSVALSILAFLQGALIVEILRSGMNRVSSTVYRRRGRFGVISRLALLTFIFVTIQLAFNPYILHYALDAIASSADYAWFVPMVWPSVAMVDQIRFGLMPAALFSALSAAFASVMFDLASRLRAMYWSPTPMNITIRSSADYVPAATTRSKFGLNPLEVAIALKELRSLVRRKDMARFIAVPIMMVIPFILPTVFSSESSRGSPGFFLMAFVPFAVTLMLSTIAVGQEGKAVVNVYMLPIPAAEFIKGKLLLTWIISGISSVGIVAVSEIVTPIGIEDIVAVMVACAFVILAGGYLGLGIGARHPDFTLGSRSRYVTLGGFIMGLFIGGAMTLAIFAPLALHLLSPQRFSILTMLPITAAVGSPLTYIAYRYCEKGVANFLANFRA